MQLGCWRKQHCRRFLSHQSYGKLILTLLALITATAISWAVTQNFTISINILQMPGPSSDFYTAQPYYTCSSNRFVSTTGSSGNNGLTSGTPWDLATAVAYAAPAGTCINLAVGIYSSTPTTFAHGGTSSSKTGYVVWRCVTMPFSFTNGAIQGEGSGCVLRNASGSGSHVSTINGGVSYLMFDALEFDGNGVTLFNCISDENNGTGGTGATSSHHIWLLNSDLHGCGQSGIQWNYTDWLFVIHSIWHDNAYSTACGCFGSGLSFYNPVGLSYTPTVGNPDYWHSATTGLTYNIVIAYNVGYHNFNVQSGSGNTDGEGIILDDWSHSQNACPGIGTCPYNGNALVMGNIIYNNGGQGIEAFSFNGPPPCTCRVTIVNNTSYANIWDTHNTGTFRADIYHNGAINNFVFNNIAVAVRGAGILADNASYLGEGNSIASGNVWQTNIGFPSGVGFDGTFNTYPTVGTNHNLDGSNPNFTAASCSAGTCTGPINFALQAGSPAIGFGQTFDLWQQQAGPVDAGACISSLTSCP